jgi:hypothetical protein
MSRQFSIAILWQSSHGLAIYQECSLIVGRKCGHGAPIAKFRDASVSMSLSSIFSSVNWRLREYPAHRQDVAAPFSHERYLPPGFVGSLSLSSG